MACTCLSSAHSAEDLGARTFVIRALELWSTNARADVHAIWPSLLRDRQLPPMSWRLASVTRGGKRWLTLTADVFQRRPLAANIAAGGVFGGIGDALCQLIAEKRTEIDRRRLGAMVVFGAGYVGGACTLIYRLYVKHTASSARTLPQIIIASAVVL